MEHITLYNNLLNVEHVPAGARPDDPHQQQEVERQAHKEEQRDRDDDVLVLLGLRFNSPQERRVSIFLLAANERRQRNTFTSFVPNITLPS